MQSLIFAGLAYVIAYFVYGKAEFMDLGIFMIPAKWAPLACSLVTLAVFSKAPSITWPAGWPKPSLSWIHLPDLRNQKPQETTSGAEDFRSLLTTLLDLELNEARQGSTEGLEAVDKLRKVVLERMRKSNA